MGESGSPDVIPVSNPRDAEPRPVAGPLVELIVRDGLLVILGLVARDLAEKRQRQPLAVKQLYGIPDFGFFGVINCSIYIARITVIAVRRIPYEALPAELAADACVLAVIGRRNRLKGRLDEAAGPVLLPVCLALRILTVEIKLQSEVHELDAAVLYEPYSVGLLV